MKKGLVLGIVLVSILLISSVSFVSAESNETGTSQVEEEICGDSICQEGEECEIDCCEAFCTLECPDGAIEGSCGCECIEPEPPEPGQEICCKITKGIFCPIGYPCTPPEVSYEQMLEEECGLIPAPGADESYEIVDNRYCEESPPEKECEEGGIKYYVCEDGTKIPECECENDNWVCKISVKDDCPESPEPETCAGQIKIAFNKDVYYIGDPIKIIIETFDSQGNHLPNYAFYGQMYDDRWHTPDLQKTDDKGYLIHTGIAEKPAGGVTEVKFKVYTKETSFCGSVEDTAEVKVELGECGMGGCAPDPECTDKTRMCGGDCPSCPEDDKDGDIFYPCNGCELEDKCYPYGYRKAGNYCLDENDVFASQLGDDEQCENNFECGTNLCINGNCVSENLWNKFLEWFKKLFGGDEEEPKDCSKLLIEENIGDNEYIESAYGVDEHTHVPVHSEDGEKIGTIKCCAAGYSTGMVMVCPFDKKEDVRNSLRWILAGGIDEGPFSLEEYKGEKVLNIGDDGILVWTKNAYLIASGGTPEAGNKFVEDLVDAYFKKYKSDFDITEDDIPYIPYIPDTDPKQWVFCTEEDEDVAKECNNRGGAPQSDPSTLDETEESKRSCIESKGYGEGCCEVYTGCIMPDEDCEEINIVSRDECYWHVARLNEDADLCEEIIDSHYKDKCLRDFAITGQDSSTCEKITDSEEQAGCYIELARGTSDDSLCENIVYDIEHRDKCYILVAEHIGDDSICENIEDSSIREKCYFWVAGQEGDIEVCEEIENIDLQTMCYAEVAEKKGDASICEKITDSHIIDKCYRDVAIATNDRSLCEKIIDDDPPLNPKDECYAGTD